MSAIIRFYAREAEVDSDYMNKKITDMQFDRYRAANDLDKEKYKQSFNKTVPQLLKDNDVKKQNDMQPYYDAGPSFCNQ